MNKIPIIYKSHENTLFSRRNGKQFVSNEKSESDVKCGRGTTKFTSTVGGSRRLIRQSYKIVHAFFNKEPGTVICLDEEWPSYKDFDDYETLISQVQDENITEKAYSVVCNATVKENSLKLDKNNKVISISPGSPLNHLLLCDDKIIDCEGVILTNDHDEICIPKRKMRNMKLTISRLGKAIAVPAMRVRKHNLIMECNDYYYYVVEVPRTVGTSLGFDVAFNSHEEDFVVINTSLNSIGRAIFEQGDHIVDINSILLSSPKIFSQIMKDLRTYPSFTALVKKPFSKSAIELTKKFINSLHTVFIKPDMKDIVTKIEEQVKGLEKTKTPRKTILKFGVIEDNEDKIRTTPTIVELPSECDSKLTFSSLEPEVIEIESNTQNPLYLENVEGNVKFL